jgi:hypothetical protein
MLNHATVNLILIRREGFPARHVARIDDGRRVHDEVSFRSTRRRLDGLICADASRTTPTTRLRESVMSTSSAPNHPI